MFKASAAASSVLAEAYDDDCSSSSNLEFFCPGPTPKPHAGFFSRQLCPYTHGFSARDTVGTNRGLNKVDCEKDAYNPEDHI